MNQRELRRILHLEIRIEREKLTETQINCREILNSRQVREMVCTKSGEGIGLERTGFGAFLSGVFRYSGIRLWGMHGIVLLLVIAGAWQLPGSPAVISLFMPLFALASIPSFYENRLWGMGEVEAATRASGAQLMLAKLILAGAADLVCLTVFLGVSWKSGRYGEELIHLILYALVPLLSSLSVILWNARKNAENGMERGISFCVGILILAVLSGIRIPWLYQTSTVGIWITAFLISGLFFAGEIRQLIRIWRGGNIYGVVA